MSGDLFHGRVPDGAVYVGRAAPGLPASPYANPHKVGDCRCGQRHDPDDAVAAYHAHLAGHPELLATARAELVGRDLACWCRTDPSSPPCHADVLLGLLHPPATNPGADPAGARSLAAPRTTIRRPGPEGSST